MLRIVQVMTCTNLGACHMQVPFVSCSTRFMYIVTCMDLGHFPCMLHACYMTCMHVICVKQWRINNRFPPVYTRRCTHYRSRWGGVSICLNVKIQNEYLYDILSIYTFLTYIKHVMLLTWNMYVTYMLFACYSCYMRCACYPYFDMHTTCILPLL